MEYKVFCSNGEHVVVSAPTPEEAVLVVRIATLLEPVKVMPNYENVISVDFVNRKRMSEAV